MNYVKYVFYVKRVKFHVGLYFLNDKIGIVRMMSF